MNKKINKEQIYEERASYSWSEDSIRLIISPSSMAKAIYFYIQEAGYFKTSDSYFTERKNLNSFLIVYTISGTGCLHYMGETYTLGTGQCFYINCMEHHYYETVKGSKWEFLWIHLNGSNALGYYQEFARSGFKIVQVQDRFFMESTLRRILAINQKRHASTEVLTSNLITNILSELMVQTITLDAQTIYQPPYIKEVLKDIDKHFKSPLSLDGLALEHGISKFHLSKEFRKYTGTTVNEYIISNRLSYAKELLKYSNIPVNEIAFKIGMNNISHFINLFKARENTTPLAYRKEWQF